MTFEGTPRNASGWECMVVFIKLYPKRSTICRQCESWKEYWQVKWWLYLMDDYLPRRAQRNCNKFKPMWRRDSAISPSWQTETLPLSPLDQHSQSDIWPQLSQSNLGNRRPPTTRVNFIFSCFGLFLQISELHQLSMELEQHHWGGGNTAVLILMDRVCNWSH